ncbi:hypothetical protein TKK_0015799 [Trichogramma kaykai]
MQLNKKQSDTRARQFPSSFRIRAQPNVKILRSKHRAIFFYISPVLCEDEKKNQAGEDSAQVTLYLDSISKTLPKQGPQITGLTQQYALGENVTANCTAWPSVPKAQLKWTINNKTVPYDYVVQHPTHQPIESQGTPNSIGLRFTIDNRYLKTASYLGALRIRCVALVGSRRFETEQPVMLAHANNQRFSAGDLRSRAPSAAYSLALLLLGTILTAT